MATWCKAEWEFICCYCGYKKSASYIRAAFS